MSLDKENKHLQELAEENKNACEFYEDACETVEEPFLKDTFKNLHKLHDDVITSIEGRLRENGEQPETDETMAGQIAKSWAELKTKLSKNPDVMLVHELEEAEDRCLHKIQDMVADDSVSELTKSLLQAEHRKLRRSHDYMKNLKEEMEQAA